MRAARFELSIAWSFLGSKPELALCQSDPELAEAIQNEAQRQVNKVELIASENYGSAAMLEALQYDPVFHGSNNWQQNRLNPLNLLTILGSLKGTMARIVGQSVDARVGVVGAGDAGSLHWIGRKKHVR